jgi:ATP-dependent DNA helicase RecG
VSEGRWSAGFPDESEKLEYKSSIKMNLHTHQADPEIARACLKTIAAFLNTEGGTLVIGVSDDKAVVGTQVDGFQSDDQYRLHVHGLIRGALGQIADSKVKISIEVIEEKNVCVVECKRSSEPVYLNYRKTNDEFYIRIGPSSLNMRTSDAHGYITDHFGSRTRLATLAADISGPPDFTAEICEAAGIEELDPNAISLFREKWSQKADNQHQAEADDERILVDAGLIEDGRATYAGLILLGRREVIDKHLPHAEVVYEWRTAEAEIGHLQRVEHREAFLLFIERLWELIDARNDIQQYQEGAYRKDIKTFNEGVVREGLLNAVAHRDYQIEGSIMVRQTPRRLEIVSPGGFPPGVTAENICRRQVPRNRRLTEAMAKCNLVERSGQGADLIFRNLIIEGKALPDFTRSDEYQVELLLQCDVRDFGFIQFLSRVGDLVTLDDLLVLECLRRDEKVGDELQPRLPGLLECGAIERTGRGMGARYLLSRELYSSMGEAGRYTRQKGLSRSVQKEYLLKHVRDAGPSGAPMVELCQVVPELSKGQVRGMMEQLRDEGRVHLEGERRGARWHNGP